MHDTNQLDPSRGTSSIEPSASPRGTIQTQQTKLGVASSQTNPYTGIIQAQSMQNISHTDLSTKVTAKIEPREGRMRKQDKAALNKAEAILKTSHKIEPSTEKQNNSETLVIKTREKEHKKKNYSDIDGNKRPPLTRKPKATRASWTPGILHHHIQQQSQPIANSSSYTDFVSNLAQKTTQKKDESIPAREKASKKKSFSKEEDLQYQNTTKQTLAPPPANTTNDVLRTRSKTDPLHVRFPSEGQGKNDRLEYLSSIIPPLPPQPSSKKQDIVPSQMNKRSNKERLDSQKNEEAWQHQDEDLPTSSSFAYTSSVSEAYLPISTQDNPYATVNFPPRSTSTVSDNDDLKIILKELDIVDKTLNQIFKNSKSRVEKIEIEELSNLHTHVTSIRNTLKESGDITYLETCDQIDALLDSIDELGAEYSIKYFSKISNFILNNSKYKGHYTFGFFSKLINLLSESPCVLSWIGISDASLQDLYKKSWSQSLHSILNEGDTENIKKQKIIQLLLEVHSTNRFISKAGRNWTDIKSDIFNQLKNHWHEKKHELLKEIEGPQDLISVHFFLEKISEEKRDAKIQELAHSFSSTIFNLRIQTFEDLMILSTDENSLEKLSSADYASGILKKTIDLSEHLSQCVTYSILSKKDPFQRARLIETYCISVNHCLEAGDLESAAAISRGLNHRAIERLHETHAALKEHIQTDIQYFAKLFSIENNFKFYRDYSHRSPHIIPCLSVLLKDREAIFAGNKGPALVKWKHKIQEEFLKITFHYQLLRLHQKMVGDSICPIYDLEDYLDKQRYAFGQDSMVLMHRSQQLEKPQQPIEKLEKK